jgi:hypothetical protein
MDLLVIILLGVAAFVQYITPAGFNPGGTPTPTLIQGPFSTPNDTLIANAISNISGANSVIVTCLANASQVGDQILVKIRTAAATSNITFSDDGSNTYTLETSEVAGSSTSAIYLAPVTTTSKCVTLTFAATTNANTDQLILVEYNNLGAVDTTCSATVTSGTSAACSAMTTTVNGDLLLAFADVIT